MERMSMVGVYKLKDKEYINRKKACEYLGCTEEILNKHIAAGKISIFYYRKAIYIKLDSVENFLLNRQQARV